jgi:hypothetical protein
VAKNFRTIACICGGAEGEVPTDALSELLGVRTNGTEIKIIKEAGLQSIGQETGQNITDVNEFLISEKYPIEVKPSELVGPGGVKLCYSMEEAQNHFSSKARMLVSYTQ